MTQLRKEQDAKNQKTHTQKDTNRIEPGCLVYKIDKALNLKGFSKKLRPRFTKLYLVLCITSTSAYIRIYKQDINTHKDLMTFEQFLHNPRDNKSKVLPNFQVEKVDLSEIKKVKNLIPLTRESEFFNDNFQIDFPDEKEFEVIEDQPIYSLGPDFDDEISRELENPIFTNNQEEESQTDPNIIFSQPLSTNTENIEHIEDQQNIAQSLPLLNKIHRKSCIKKITNRKIKFEMTHTAIDENGTFSYEAIQDKYTLGTVGSIKSGQFDSQLSCLLHVFSCFLAVNLL